MSKHLKHLFLFFAVILLTACSSVGQYVLPTHRFVGAVIVSNDVNPTSSGRASPITLYFFQLKGADTFNSTNFFALYNNPQQTLGKDYVDMGKIDLAPGSRTEVNFALNPDTQYVGLVAAYQQLPRSVWRTVVPMNSWGKERVYVRVDSLTLTANNLAGDDSSTSSFSGLTKQASGALSSSGQGGASGGDSSGGDSSGSGGGWADKAKSAVSGPSNSSGASSSSSGSSSDGSASGGNDSAGGGIMQKYKNVKSAISGGK